MKITPMVFASAALLFAAQVHAGDTPSTDASGKQMQSESGPGASEYAPPSGDSGLTPGQQMKEETGPGASQHAPGHTMGADADRGKTKDSDPSPN